MKVKIHSGWRTVKLGEVCELNPRRPKLDRATSTPTTFVQMSAVAENGGGIVRPETRPFGQVSKGYTFFAEGDVIFAKITPCMQNGKHAIAGNLLDGIGFGSTEFHVFRPGGEIISEWILNFLLQPKVLTEATRHFTGAVGQQRVPENVLADMEIELPPVLEQRRIVARLRAQMAEVERARAANQSQLEAIDALPAALRRAAFNGEQ
jgi:type I restriction enzyme S subunit